MAAAQATAHALDHFEAVHVIARAAEAHAVRQHFAGAFAAIETAFAASRLLARAANAALTAFHFAASLLKLCANAFVLCRAVDLAAIRTLLDADFAARNDSVQRARRTIHTSRLLL